MRILFTGASSFTGTWLVRELVVQGHSVCTAMRAGQDSYDGLRRERLETLPTACELAWNAPFGTPAFMQIIESRGPFDLLCHHGAEVANYKSADFDACRALSSNTLNLSYVLDGLNSGGCRRVLLTGSVFEGNEGAGSEPSLAFSPYGLSKELTGRSFRYYTSRAGMGLGKFVIPNPFGPFEEPRFTAYLMKAWYAGNTARVATPAYVRDNIHVSLLAKSYAHFAATLPETGFRRLGPSGYVESQGAFAQRFAREMGARLGLRCELELAVQSEFLEPAVRINTDTPSTALNWEESAAWDQLAEYYRGRLSPSVQAASNVGA